MITKGSTMKSRQLVLLAVATCFSVEANAVLIGYDTGDARNSTSFSVSTSGGVDPVNWDVGDWFGWAAASSWPQSAGMPFALADDSVFNVSGQGPFPPDTQGIIEQADFNNTVFGVVDTVNSLNPVVGSARATWTFDVSGATGLSVSVDIAAMGDFEASTDTFQFLYGIDGGGLLPLFTVAINEGATQAYTMQSGTVVTQLDPASLGGVLLDDVFSTFSAAIAGTGSTLTLVFDASTDGGSEAFAFDNIRVSAVPVPATVALFGIGLAGLGVAKRRMKQSA
jgi:hypothetical protein